MKKSIILASVSVMFSMAAVPMSVNMAFIPPKSQNAAEVITENTGLEKEIKSGENNNIVNNGENALTQQKGDLFENAEKSQFESYITGVVAAEMPALYEKEALKAQAVAARTYAKRRMDAGNSLETMIENGGQAYCSIEDMKEKWGDNFDEYYEKVKSAVDETKGEIMVYDGEPILAVFHAISSGKTETASNVWSNDEPYLKSVESPMDTQAQDYETEVIIPEKEAVSKLKEAKPSLVLGEGSLAGQTQVIERSSAGYITEIQIGNTVFTGREVREILGLRSSDFSIVQNGDDVVFTTKGYGHGAGMSQYGANCLALEGKSYHDILEYYYTDISFLKE